MLQSDISVRKMSDGVDRTHYEVTIQHTIEPGGIRAKGNITLHCKVGSNAYSLLIYKPHSVEGDYITTLILYLFHVM